VRAERMSERFGLGFAQLRELPRCFHHGAVMLAQLRAARSEGLDAGSEALLGEPVGDLLDVQRARGGAAWTIRRARWAAKSATASRPSRSARKRRASRAKVS